jgi:hypothetical protein
MSEESQSGVAQWAQDLRMNADALLVNGQMPMTGDLFLAEQLRKAYIRYSGEIEDNRLINRFGRALTEAGFDQVHGRRPVAGPDVVVGRYYAIRNAEKWLKAPLTEIQAHLRGEALSALEKKNTPKKRKF